MRVAPMRRQHRQPLLDLLRATDAFREEEIEVALELFDETAAGGAREQLDESGSGYRFLGLFDDDSAFRTSHAALGSAVGSESGSQPAADFLIGYACYGATPGTDGTWDLYWIAVHPSAQGSGGGRMLLEEVERRIVEEGARMIVVETSSRSDYEGTRQFYGRRGYREGARVQGFYAPGDDRVIYIRRFPPEPVAGGASQQ